MEDPCQFTVLEDGEIEAVTPNPIPTTAIARRLTVNEVMATMLWDIDVDEGDYVPALLPTPACDFDVPMDVSIDPGIFNVGVAIRCFGHVYGFTTSLFERESNGKWSNAKVTMNELARLGKLHSEFFPAVSQLVEHIVRMMRYVVIKMGFMHNKTGDREILAKTRVVVEFNDNEYTKTFWPMALSAFNHLGVPFENCYVVKPEHVWLSMKGKVYRETMSQSEPPTKIPTKVYKTEKKRKTIQFALKNLVKPLELLGRLDEHSCDAYLNLVYADRLMSALRPHDILTESKRQ